MRVKFKPGAKAYLDNLHFHTHVDDFQLDRLKNIKSPLVLEIGLGKGDYLLAMAKAYPDYFFMGIELNASVLSVAAQKLANANLENILILTGDAKYLLPKLKKESLSYIILNHSDPWPKKRHEKRRLTHPSLIKKYYDLLKPGGELIFKTDNDDFAEYSYATLKEAPFSSLLFNRDYKGDAPFDAKTEYEVRFLLKDVKIKMITGKK
ncbi:MAG: tRNA (guanine-N(7)-)-methyltransferase [Tenericutes bacterium ADurb.Bin239]|nr:MAG: tRNA (guanine-N(7)-)-methyltransferase [Tenericutes bacterium ADurb.Bin239]